MTEWARKIFPLWQLLAKMGSGLLWNQCFRTWISKEVSEKRIVMFYLIFTWQYKDPLFYGDSLIGGTSALPLVFSISLQDIQGFFFFHLQWEQHQHKARLIKLIFIACTNFHYVFSIGFCFSMTHVMECWNYSFKCWLLLHAFMSSST